MRGLSPAGRMQALRVHAQALRHARMPVALDGARRDAFPGVRDEAMGVHDGPGGQITGTPWQAKIVGKNRGQRRRSDTVTGSDLGFCAPSGTRTPNPLIKSQLLCQLS